MPHSKKEKNRRIALDLHSLIETSKILNASLDLEFILAHILRTVMGKLLIFRACIITCDENQTCYKLASHRGLPNAPIEFDELETFKQNYELLFSTPIKSGEKLVGYICLGSKFNKEKFSHSEISFLDSLASLAASAIENAVFIQKLNQLNQRLEQKISQLNTLFQLSNAFKIHKSRQELFESLAETLYDSLSIEKVLILSTSNEKPHLEYAKQINIDQPLLEQIQPLLNIEQTERLTRFKYPILFEKGFQACIPLKNNTTFGIVLCGSNKPEFEFSESDIEFMFLASNNLAEALEQMRFFDEALKRKALEKELDVAYDIQSKLFPKHIPSDEEMDIATYYKPSRQVGGDYYDIFEIDNDHLFLAIADVTGKGIPASLLMSNLQALIKAYIELVRLKKMSLFEMVGKINNIIFQNTSSDKFISFFCAILQKSTKTMQSVNAGHNPPLLLKKSGEITMLTHGGVVLGVIPTQRTYDYETHQLEPGDLLFLYTDGVTETMSEAREEYGVDRLGELLQSNHHLNSEGIIDKMIQVLAMFSGTDQQADDTTAICMKFK